MGFVLHSHKGICGPVLWRLEVIRHGTNSEATLTEVVLTVQLMTKLATVQEYMSLLVEAC